MQVAFVLRYLRACSLRAIGALWLAKRRARWKGVIVATLHRVLDDSEFHESSSLPATLVRKDTFEQFVRWITRNFDVVDLRHGVPAWSMKRPRVALTFDDGWLDNYTLAEPIASRFQCPITIFVCSGIIGKRFPFWPERVSYLLSQASDIVIGRLFPDLSQRSQPDLIESVVDRMKKMPPDDRERRIEQLETSIESGQALEARELLNRTMTWEQIQEISQRKTGIGSHTFSHQILTTVPADKGQEELTTSRRHIEATLKLPCSMLAYPNGNHNPDIRNAANKAGYTIAFANERGCWTKKTDLFRVPRINIWERKLTSPNGKFSRAMAEYYLFWKL